MAAEIKTKYDRQLRIWGEQGQAALEQASVCLLNCGPTGSEALKNLVLGGIGSITVVDGTKVEKHDLGNNFMLDEAGLGQSKAKCVCAFLQELNDAVKAKFVEESPEALIEGNASFFSPYTLVIATQLLERSLLKLDKICRQSNVMLLVARSYGLTGIVRISLKEHGVVESKPEHFVDDLRLHCPWPELKEFAKSIDLNVTDPVVHKHIPYIVILIHIAEKWADKHDGCLPTTRQEKKEFKDLIKAHMLNIDEENYKEAIESSYKVSIPHGISSQLRQIINDSAVEVDSASPDFWILVAALKEFIENEGAGEPPLEGSIPDMTSLTEYYISLQKVYQAKFESDCLAIENRVRTILKRIGRDPDFISKAFIKNFCKNARKLTVCRYRPLEDEFCSPAISELQKYMTDEDYSFSVGFYILLRAVDRFITNYNRFPGLFDNELEDDLSRLKTVAVSVLGDSGLHGSTLTEDLINEMCRFGGAEIHAVSAFIGGVASQEAIKLITKQFVPLNGTLVFNGIDQKSQALRASPHRRLGIHGGKGQRLKPSIRQCRVRPYLLLEVSALNELHLCSLCSHLSNPLGERCEEQSRLGFLSLGPGSRPIPLFFEKSSSDEKAAIFSQIIAYLMVTSSSSAMELLYLAREGDREVSWGEVCSYHGEFCGRAKASLVLHSLALLCFVCLSLISGLRAFSSSASDMERRGSGEN